LPSKDLASNGSKNAGDAFGILFASNPQPMWVYDLRTLYFLDVNAAAIARYGYDRDTFLRMRITDIRPGQDLEHLAQNLKQSRAPLEAAGRWRHTLRDGQVIDVEITSHTISYGRQPAALVLVTDVTEQVQAETTMQHLEERFALVFQASPAALVITRLADGRYVDVNRSYELLFGWTREELLGHAPYEFGVYDSPSERDNVVEQLRETGSMRNFDVRMRAKSGEMRDVLASVEVIDFAGEPCILSVVIDVSDYHRAQAALRQRETELALLAEASAVLGSSLDYEQTLSTVAELAVPHIADWCAVHILDEDGSVREVAVAHVDPAKVEMARELQRRYPPDPDDESGIQKVARTGEPEVFPEIPDAMLEAAARDPEHLALMRQLGFCSALTVPLITRDRTLGALTLVSAESGRHFGSHEVALAQDLARRAGIAVENARLFSERTSAVEAVRTLNAELEQRVQDRTIQLAAANAELEAFAYSVSHDLRAPLRSMDGFSKVLADRYATSLDERGLRYLQHIRDAAREMGQLIDALLRLARLTRSEMRWQRVDLSHTARSLAEGLRQRAPDRDVRLSIADGIVVTGDEQLLRVLLENLLGNAWKFSRDRSPSVVSFGVTRIAGEDACFVRDNGAGFDQRYASKLFGPFQRLHRASEFEGTGIGLATVQRVVHRHGGRVWADGKVGEGATFYFTLAAPGESTS
jgi:PAS domain S-box-containing protein